MGLPTTTCRKTRFQEIYEALPPKAEVAPKTAFVREIAALCKVHPTTVRSWIYGAQRPDALKTSIIAEHLGEDAENLFK